MQGHSITTHSSARGGRVLFSRSRITAKERDAETGLDYFGARYLSSNMGRFSSPDDGSDQEPDSPQSWNLYSYVRNNPLIYADPDGRDCIYQDPDSGKITGFNRGDCDNSTTEKANAGIYVDGTVTSASYDSQSQTLNFTFNPYDGGAGVGAITGVPATQPPAGMSNGAVTPLMLGPGDLALFAGVKMPSVLTNFFGKLLGPVLDKSAAEQVTVNTNKLFHIFGNPGHNLGGLVAKFGSQEAAFKALQQATEAAVQQKGLTGVFQTTVEVAGETVTVRGNVVGGAVKLGTAYK